MDPSRRSGTAAKEEDAVQPLHTLFLLSFSLSLSLSLSLSRCREEIKSYLHGEAHGERKRALAGDGKGKVFGF